MKNRIQRFLAAALVLAIGLFGCTRYETQSEVDAGAAYARKSYALVAQQLSMIEGGDNATVGEYFSTTRKVSDELSACVVDIDSREWKRSPQARDAARTLCSAAKGLILTLEGSARLRIERHSAEVKSEKILAAISKSKNSDEIEQLTKRATEAFDEEMKNIEQENNNMPQNRERVQAMLVADSRAVQVLGVKGLNQDVKSLLGALYLE